MEDADLLVGLDSDPDVMRYVDDGVPVSRQDIVENTLPAFLAYYDRFDGYGFWAAIEKATDRFIGWFHFRPGEGAGPLEPELGYRLHPFAWNRGLRPKAPGPSSSGIHRDRDRAGDRRVHGRPRCFPPGDGEGRHAPGARLQGRLAGADPGRRSRRRRVRNRASRVGGRPDRGFLNRPGAGAKVCDEGSRPIESRSAQISRVFE